jgi:hypothetical protein
VPAGGPSGCSGSDNCPYTANPGQEDSNSNNVGDACDPYLDGEGDSDGDSFPDYHESGAALCHSGGNADSFDDSVNNDGCPAVGAPETNCTGGDEDSDGRINDGCPPVGQISEGNYNIGTSPQRRCGVGAVPAQSIAWPLDLVSGGAPDSTDRITITDLTSFLAPIRRLDTKPGDAGFNARWDLKPGPVFSNWISIGDLTSLFAGVSGFPPMNGGQKVFGTGFQCTAHPVYGD